MSDEHDHIFLNLYREIDTERVRLNKLANRLNWVAWAVVITQVSILVTHFGIRI